MKNTNTSGTRTKVSPQLVEVRVAARLASLRREQGLTLRDLGLKAGLSDAYLSRVENNRTAVTIANLSKLATALGTSISAFFQDETEDRHLVICRSGQGKGFMLREATKLRGYLLAKAKSGKLMEPILVDVRHVPAAVELKSHAGEEFNFILEGECEVIYGKEKVALKQGDSLYYDASIPHAVRGTNDKKCLLLAVIASKDYLFHGDLSRLLKDGG